MIETVRISSKGQVVIPESFRKRLSIKEGTRLVMVEKEGKIILEKEQAFVEAMERLKEQEEKMGWLALAEQNLKKVWDNEKDDVVWQRYL